MALMQQIWDHGYFFFPCRQHALVLYSKYRGHVHIQGLLSTAVLQKHSILDLHTAVALHLSELLLSMSLTHSHKVAAPDHSIQHNPTTVPEPAMVALALSAVHAPRSERTAVHAPLARMREIFSARIYLPSVTYLNLVNADFFVLAFFFRVGRVGGALTLAAE